MRPSEEERQRGKMRVLDSLSGADALTILERLAAKDARFAAAIEAAARELLSDVDPDEVATEVREALELLEPEDVWDRSGRTRHGYVDSAEAAWEIFDEAMEPFRADMRRHLELGLNREADRRCLGILIGLYDFEKLSASAFKDWAMDAPSDYFCIVLREWKSLRKGRLPLTKMRRSINEHCPDHVQLAEQIL